MGWNVVQHDDKSEPNEWNAKKPEFYFLHSYYFDCTDSEM